MNLAPHQQRVIDEKKELGEKISKLTEFVFKSDTFATLPREEQDAMLQQLNVMGQYAHILAWRIKMFEPANETSH